MPGVRANDGVVPLRSQLHGELLWAGHADHLDVLGHFDDKDHADWLRSGSAFSRSKFDALMDAIAGHFLAASERFKDR